MNRYAMAFDQSSFGNGEVDDRAQEHFEEVVLAYTPEQLSRKLTDFIEAGNEAEYLAYIDWIDYAPADVLIVDEDEAIFNRLWNTGEIKSFLVPLLVARKGKTWTEFLDWAWQDAQDEFNQ